ncbi:MAG TPA: hypothetical protein VH253_05215 [Phycisphaerae bacterium]|nr:hypothetical protein [Phycisphaerae bacterium]
MDANAVVLAILDALNAANIPFMLVGSLSSNAYGIPRSTKDADLVLQLGNWALHQIFGKLPPGFVVESQIGFETITSTTRYRIQYAPLPFTIELFELSGDPHDQLRFSSRIATTYLGAKAFLPRPEDVIITKLRWFQTDPRRVKDIEDVRNVIAVQTTQNLDLPYIRHWTDQHQTRELFEKLLAETPKI